MQAASENSSTVSSRWGQAASGTDAHGRADASTHQQRKTLTPNTRHFWGPSTASAAASSSPPARISAEGISQQGIKSAPAGKPARQGCELGWQEKR